MTFPSLTQRVILTFGSTAIDFSAGAKLSLTITFLASEGYTEDEDIENTFVSGNDGCPIFIYLCEPDNFYKELFQTTGSSDFIEDYLEIEIEDPESEEAIFESLGLQYIEPELRETKEIVDLASANKIPTLIEFTDLKGILHNHSTYSDGMNSLEEMEHSIILKD